MTIFIFFRILITQVENILEVQNLFSKKKSLVLAKEKVLSFFGTISENQIESNYQLVTTALPIQKDIILIFGELNTAASRANVELGGFSLQVGNVYVEDNKAIDTKKNINGVPYLNILVGVSGDSRGLRAFADELYKSLPLVEIESIDISQRNARYEVNFFYKPISLRTDSDNIEMATPLSSVENQQLEILNSWNIPTEF